MRSRLGLSATVAAMFIAVVAASLARGATPAAAHPLGNFTINHYDRITVSGTSIEVYSVLDMAEIPAFRERQQIDANGDGNIDAAETEAYASQKIEELSRNFTLRVDGHPLSLSAVSHELTFPGGQGGLSLLRLTARYSAPVAASQTTQQVAFEDHNYEDRLGWREIVISAGGNVAVDGASAARRDISSELTSYPQDALSSPLDVRSASFSFFASAGAMPDAAPAVTHPATTAVRGNPDSPLARFAGLVAKDHLSAGVIALALLAAAGFGAIHALSPGHGKTIVAAYLVGSKGTARHALTLGLTVTLTHTSSVYALGFITLYLSEYIVPERLYPWLTLASGGLIVAMGLALLVGRTRSSGLVDDARAWMKSRLPQGTGIGRSASMALATADAGAPGLAMPDEPMPSGLMHSIYQHDHGHERQHEHEGMHRPRAIAAVSIAEHTHGFGRPHSHGPAVGDDEAVTWRRLLGLGIFGGMLPCPSAIVVMLSAISLHRVGFGLVLIVAFSLGLAGVLTGIGFALVYGRQIFRRLPLLGALVRDDQAAGGVLSFAARAFPVASAVAVFAAGLVVMYPALGKI